MASYYIYFFVKYQVVFFQLVQQHVLVKVPEHEPGVPPLERQEEVHREL